MGPAGLLEPLDVGWLGARISEERRRAVERATGLGEQLSVGWAQSVIGDPGQELVDLLEAGSKQALCRGDRADSKRALHQAHQERPGVLHRRRGSLPAALG